MARVLHKSNSLNCLLRHKVHEVWCSVRAVMDLLELQEVSEISCAKIGSTDCAEQERNTKRRTVAKCIAIDELTESAMGVLNLTDRHTITS